MESDHGAATRMTADQYSSDIRHLCVVAVREITEHLNDNGLCVICGSAWPCERTVLAEHNLALL